MSRTNEELNDKLSQLQNKSTNLKDDLHNYEANEQLWKLQNEEIGRDNEILKVQWLLLLFPILILILITIAALLIILIIPVLL